MLKLSWQKSAKSVHNALFSYIWGRFTVDFISSVFNVSYQLSIAAFSALSTTSLFTLSQKIKPNTSPTHQIIQLSIAVRRRRDETESKCTFLKVIICLCHRSDGNGNIKRARCSTYLAISRAELLPTVGLPKMGPVDQSWITVRYNYSLPEILKYICILTLQWDSAELCFCRLVCSLLLHTVTHTCMDENKLLCLTLLAAPTLQANRTGLLHILTKWGKWPFVRVVTCTKKGRKLYGEKEMDMDVFIGAEAQGSEGGSCTLSLCCIDGE